MYEWSGMANYIISEVKYRLSESKKKHLFF